jgi:hypothetical protein
MLLEPSITILNTIAPFIQSVFVTIYGLTMPSSCSSFFNLLLAVSQTQISPASARATQLEQSLQGEATPRGQKGLNILAPVVKLAG